MIEIAGGIILAVVVIAFAGVLYKIAKWALAIGLMLFAVWYLTL